jgi:hypothetical protein
MAVTNFRGRLVARDGVPYDIRYFESGSRKASFLVSVWNQRAKPLTVNGQTEQYAPDDLYLVELWNEAVDALMALPPERLPQHRDLLEFPLANISGLKQEHWVSSTGEKRFRQVIVFNCAPSLYKRYVPEGEAPARPTAGTAGKYEFRNGKFVKVAEATTQVDDVPAEYAELADKLFAGNK